MDGLVLAQGGERDRGMRFGQRDVRRRRLTEQNRRGTPGEKFGVIRELFEILDQAATAARAAGGRHDDAGAVDPPGVGSR